MIAREILKKPQQREFQMNQLVKASSPVFQLFRVAAGVKNGQDHDSFGFNHKMNYKGETAQDYGTPDFAAHFRKAFRIIRDTLKIFFNRCTEFLAQTFALIFIPGDGIIKFLRGNPAKDKTAFHLRYFASSFALSSSREMTSSGLSRCSCMRRSINSASPGVNSFDSTMSPQRLRHSSICSANGSARASFKTDSEFMGLNLMAVRLFASA
jgi:hypothetical protein